MKWIDRRIEKASFLSFAIWFALLYAYSYWAFYLESPWARALDAGGGVLPESQPGFPPGEPALSLAKLDAAATNDYVLWQAFDIPYAFVFVMASTAAMALALKKTKLGKTPLRCLIVLPFVYIACEIVENALVALFALKLLPKEGVVVLVQQLATTVKFISGFPSGIIGLFSVAVALIAIAVGFLRRKKT